MKIKVIWWSGTLGKADRHTVQPLKELGHDVELINGSVRPGDFRDADLIFTPIVNIINLFQINIPIIFQFGGYDYNTVLPNGQITNGLEKIFTSENMMVNFLDPSIYDTINSTYLKKFTVSRNVTMIPNGISSDLSELNQPKISNTDYTVFHCSGLDSLKNPMNFYSITEDIEKWNKKIKFITLGKFNSVYNLEPEWLGKNNVTVKPKQTYQEMGELYNSADLILHHSDTEVFPNSMIEAMYLEKPIVAHNIGKYQTISVDKLNEVKSTFGEHPDQVIEKIKKYYNTGNYEHYVHAHNTPDRIAQVYNDNNLSNHISKNAKKWTDVWISQKERFRILLKRAEELIL